MQVRKMNFETKRERGVAGETGGIACFQPKRYMNEKDVQFLKQGIPFWKGLTPDQQSNLLAQAANRQFQKGDMLHGGGGQCAGLFLVKKGQLRVYLISDTGKEITMYRLFEQDICIFSASCIMKNITFDVFVEAESDTDALVIPAELYEKLLKESLPVAEYTNQLMSARFSDVMWMIEQALFMSFDKRLAIFLLEQSGIDGSDTLHITQERVAQHMGSAREVVTRMLKYFHQEGMVELFRGGIQIINRKKLTEVAGS